MAVLKILESDAIWTASRFDPLLYSMVPCPSFRGGTQPELDAEGADEGEENNDKEGTNDDSPAAGDANEGEGTNGKEGTNDDSPSTEVTNDDSPSTPTT